MLIAWNNLKISTKFSIGFGILLLTLLSIAGSGIRSLDYIHKAEVNIVTQREIQRLVLSMDRSLQRARYLHSSYFQSYPQIGLKKAHEKYAQASISEAAKAIRLSKELQRLLDTSGISKQLNNHQADLNLYLASAKRFATTSIASYELLTRLISPSNGLEMQLTQQFEAIKRAAHSSPKLRAIFDEMYASLQHYSVSKKRSSMQAVINSIRKLREAITAEPGLNMKKEASINRSLEHLLIIGEEIVAINEQIKSTFNDFLLQEENLSATAQNLLTLVNSAAGLSQIKIDQTRRFTQRLNLLLSFIGFGVAITIIWLLNRSITDRIQTLTKTAEKLKTGDISVSFLDDAKDELGTLAQVFNSLTRQRSSDIKRLHAANVAMQNIQNSLEITVGERTNELRKLLMISNRLSTSNDTTALYRECTSLCKELFQFDFSTLMLLAADKKHLVVQDTIGFSQAYIGTLALVKGQGLSTHVVAEKKAAVVTDFLTEKRFEIPPIVLEKKIHSALCAPMMIGDEVFGVLIGHTLNKRHFNSNEVSLYCSLANQAAVAIDNTLHIKKIRASEQKFHTFFDNANDAIIIFEPGGVLLEANTVACDSLGYSHAEILNMTTSKLIAPNFSQDLPERLEAITRSGKQIFESAYLHRNGSIIPMELSCTFFEFDTYPAILVVARDITERKNMEKELIKVERLESVGVLAGGIAHDFNNILSSILGNINLARLDGDVKKETRSLLQEAETASIRARGLTRQLLTFAKGGDPVKEIASVARVIRDCGDFVLRGSNVSCDYSFDNGLWDVEIDKGQISQVIQNLIINARHAMPGGGAITISCKNSSYPHKIHHLTNTERYLLVTIQDHGIGIPGHIIDKIFDPYFTTKQEGSGLGLAVSHSIIMKHGGFIFASSVPEQGTTFSIYLPATSAATTMPPESPAKAVEFELTETTGRTVLVMDDDTMVLQVTKAILEAIGYKVLQAKDGQEAIGIYRKAQKTENKIDVIIMDLTIPGGMGGKKAVQEILAIDPEAKVMVSSGYSNDPIMANYQEYGFQAAVNKPFNLQELQRELQRISRS